MVLKMINALFRLLLMLALTIIIEGCVIGLFFRNWRFVYYSLLCNLLTNPAMNLILMFLPFFLGFQYYPFLLILLELTVVLIEAYIYKILCRFHTEKAFFVSLLVNAISYGIGTFLPF